jgi:hypothetical protein
MAAKGKKGKKGKKEKKEPSGPIPVTTAQILQDRTKMLCPRMGDIYDRNEQVENILEVFDDKYILLTLCNSYFIVLRKSPSVVCLKLWTSI